MCTIGKYVYIYIYIWATHDPLLLYYSTVVSDYLFKKKEYTIIHKKC